MPAKPKPKKPRQTRGAGEGTVTQRADGRWMARVTIGYGLDGKQQRKALYGATREECVKKLNEELYKIGKFGKSQIPTMTIGQALTAFAESKRSSVSYSTQITHRTYLTHLLPLIGNVKATALNALTLENAYNALVSVLGPSSRIHLHQFVKSALERLVQSDLIPYNPAARVTVPKRQQQPVAVAWSSDEVSVFLEAAKDHSLFPLWHTALQTGMRVGELVTLKWSAINLKTGRLEVVTTRIRSASGDSIGLPKKGKTRHVFLPPSTLKILEQHKETTGSSNWVFPSSADTMLSVRNVARAFKIVIKRVGLRDIRMHDLRVTHTSLAIRGGQDPKLVADRLGHADVSMTLRVYRQVADEERRSSTLDLSDLLKKAKK